MKIKIKNFKNLYSVDDLGNVYSLITTKSRRKGKLKQYISNGYKKVNLYDEFGNCKKCYVHRLVAEAFILNPNNYKEVNHIDCNKENNTVHNLEWCNRIQNLKHSWVNCKKRCGERHGMHKLRTNEVIKIKELLNDKNLTQKEISILFHVSQSTISAINTNRLWNEVMLNVQD